MLTSIYLLLSLSTLDVDVRAGETDLTRIETTRTKTGLQLAWHDTEDVLKGVLSPATLRVGKPIVVSVTLGHIQGEDLFDGPLIVSLRPLDQMGTVDTATVTRSQAERGWKHEFTPTSSGSHRLEIAWSSTRHKQVMGVIEVEDALLPPWFGYAFAFVFLTAGVGYGLFALFRRGEK
jgi:hypothetical protein